MSLQDLPWSSWKVVHWRSCRHMIGWRMDAQPKGVGRAGREREIHGALSEFSSLTFESTGNAQQTIWFIKKIEAMSLLLKNQRNSAAWLPESRLSSPPSSLLPFVSPFSHIWLYFKLQPSSFWHFHDSPLRSSVFYSLQPIRSQGKMESHSSLPSRYHQNEENSLDWTKFFTDPTFWR